MHGQRHFSVITHTGMYDVVLDRVVVQIGLGMGPSRKDRSASPFSTPVPVTPVSTLVPDHVQVYCMAAQLAMRFVTGSVWWASTQGGSLRLLGDLIQWRDKAGRMREWDVEIP